MLKRTVIISMVSNIFQWYAFTLFGYLAPVIGQLFFPSLDKTLQLLFAFGTFAAGYLARPLGGLIFGYIGDKLGRKYSVVLTIFVMVLPTVLIGILPTYKSMGIFASVLLILLRMLQGISMGGNYAGTITLTTEHSTQNKKGLIGCLTVTGCLLGVMLGSSVVAFLSSMMSDNSFEIWGWRIPFILGILAIIPGCVMSRFVPEPPSFVEAKKRQKLLKNPILASFRDYPKILTSLVFITMLHDLSFYIFFIYLPSHFTEFLNFDRSAILLINTINIIIVIIFAILSAILSDIHGRKIVMGIAAIFLLISTIPLFFLLNQTKEIYIVFLIQAILAIGVGSYLGPMPALLSESLPTSIRNSGLAIITNISGPLFGGASPFIVTNFIKLTNSYMAPGIYLTLGAFIAYLVLRKSKLSLYK
ncbi:MAG: MFS transporter [Alphaproteobacteria bacterium]